MKEDGRESESASENASANVEELENVDDSNGNG